MIADRMENKENSIIINENIDVNTGKTTNVTNDSHNTQNEKKSLRDEKDIVNRSKELNIYFNNLINYINKNNMGNENIRSQIQNLQKLMINIADENYEMKGKIKEMEQDIKIQKEDITKLTGENQMQKQDIIKLTGENQKQKKNILKLTEENEIRKKEIQDLEENIEILKDECQDIKEILGNIQCRTLSKNFLRAFGTFLTNDDKNEITKNKKKKGEIISNRIKQLYPKANKQKMNLIKKLIEKSWDLQQQGNYYAHSITLEKYEDEINAYKQKNHLKTLSSPLAFCFLISLGISGNLFDNAYSFLTQFFNSNLNVEKEKFFLDLFFK